MLTVIQKIERSLMNYGIDSELMTTFNSRDGIEKTTLRWVFHGHMCTFSEDEEGYTEFKVSNPSRDFVMTMIEGEDL